MRQAHSNRKRSLIVPLLEVFFVMKKIDSAVVYGRSEALRQLKDSVRSL